MESLGTLFQILAYTLPGILVLIGVRMVLQMQWKKEQQEASDWVKKESLKQLLPLRLSAYERAILYLERIAPENLLPRVNPSSLDQPTLHRVLINEIREEYEHNLAQQLYISQAGWLALVEAKEKILNLINQAADEMENSAEASGIAFGKFVLEKYSQLSELPTQKATKALKEDIHKYLS